VDKIIFITGQMKKLTRMETKTEHEQAPGFESFMVERGK
jgi:hypothetical protein